MTLRKTTLNCLEITKQNYQKNIGKILKKVLKVLHAKAEHGVISHVFGLPPEYEYNVIPLEGLTYPSKIREWFERDLRAMDSSITGVWWGTPGCGIVRIEW